MRSPPISTISWILPRTPRMLLALFLLIAGSLLSFGNTSHAQNQNAPVYIVEIHGTIDLGLAPYLARVLDDAEKNEAAAVVLEINTPGGRLDAVLQMRDTLVDSPVRTIAFVNQEAFSAGALIAISSQEIYMVRTAVMGAATPVDGTGESAGEKVISAVRSTFKSTAEFRGRNPIVAEAMVDPEVVVDGLSEAGKLVTLTATEAQEWGYADAIVADRAELFQVAGLEGLPVEETSPHLAERLVRFLTDPIVASLLTSLGFLLILADIYSGGIGLLSAAGAGMFALFFWGHFLAGLAGWESVVLMILGLVLIAVEVFIIPGFGVPGVLGIAALLGGLYLAVIGREIVTGQDIQRGLTTVGLSFVLMVAGTILLIWLLPRAKGFQSLVLQSHVGEVRPKAATQPVTERRGWLRGSQPTFPPVVLRDTVGEEPSRNEPSLVGSRGTALSTLRPGGIAIINNQRIDVVSEGDYIPAGSPVQVVLDERYRRVVRRVTTDEDPGENA